MSFVWSAQKIKGAAAVAVVLVAATGIAREAVAAPRPDWMAEPMQLRSESLSPEAQQRIRGLSAFYRAAREDEPERRMELLVDALNEESESPFLMNMFLEEAGRGLPVSGEQKLRLLELAERQPEQERIAVLLLMLDRQNPDDEYAYRRRILARRLVERLLHAAEVKAEDRDLGELRRWLLAALLSYGNLSCALGEAKEAEAFFQARLREEGVPAVRDMVLEAAALFYSDLRNAAQNEREEQRCSAALRRVLGELALFDAKLLPIEEVVRRVGSYECLGENVAAENLLRRQLARSGNLPLYRLALAEFLQRHLRLEEAASVAGLLAADFPNVPAFASVSADIDLGRGAFDGAIRTLGHWAQLQPEELNWRFRLALALYGYGEVGAAEQLLAGLPQNEWRVVVFRLNIMREARRFQEAVALAARFEIAMDQVGGFQDKEAAAGFYRALLRIAYDRRDTELARQCLRRFQRYHLLEEAESCNELGYVLTELDIELEVARRLVEQALALRPESPEILDSMAWICYRQRELAEARRFIDAALAAYEQGILTSGNGVVLEHAGEIYLALGEYRMAEELWQRALASGDPEIDVQNLRKKLEQLRASRPVGAADAK